MSFLSLNYVNFSFTVHIGLQNCFRALTAYYDERYILDVQSHTHAYEFKGYEVNPN